MCAIIAILIHDYSTRVGTYSCRPHKWRFSSAASTLESTPSANVRRSGERKSEKRAKEEEKIKESNSKF